jgi:hypothetical protein
MTLFSQEITESDADYRRRVRRARYASRNQGYELIKSRTRTEAAQDFGQFFIVKGSWHAASEHGLDLDEVEAFLSQ